MESIEALREYAGRFDNSHDAWSGIARDLSSIADAIEREVGEMQRALTIDAKPMTDENMAEGGLMRLPLDAEGVPWRIGDVIAWPDGSGHKSVIGIGKDWLFYVDSECEYRADWTVANDKRHHHAPTVEDVLREFADRVCKSGHQWGLDAADTIAEYADKLQLKED